MPLLGAAIMDTERMIPNSRSSVNGSSPGSGNSTQNGPIYASSNPSNLVVNSVARKKKTERLVPPLIPTHNLVNGSNGDYNNSSYINSNSAIYGSPMSAGLSNPGFSRDSIK